MLQIRQSTEPTVLALGTRFSDRVALNPDKFGKRAIKVQVDIDSSEINKNVVVDYGITAGRERFPCGSPSPHQEKGQERMGLSGNVLEEYYRRR